MRKQIDVLWIIEHIAREMDVACAVKYISKSRYNINIKIYHLVYDSVWVLEKYNPKIVVLPFLYSSSNPSIAQFIKAWPNAIFFNLSWEELYSDFQGRIKALEGDFTKNKVIHHAWGDFYKKILLQSGVLPGNIFVNGNPAYQLYYVPYKQLYEKRDWLAERYKLNKSSRWIFIPDAFKWAFYTEESLKSFVDVFKVKLNELQRMRRFCKDSLIILMKWINDIADNDALEIIYRPKPASSLNNIETFFSGYIGEKSRHLHFIKSESVREWIIASDVVVASFSTSLIEAALAGKTVSFFEPIPIIDSFHAEWHTFFPRLRTFSDFSKFCLFGDTGSGQKTVKAWAEKVMLGNGDPIINLADFLEKLVAKQQGVTLKTGEYESQNDRIYIYSSNHDRDFFTSADIRKRVSDFHRILSLRHGKGTGNDRLIKGIANDNCNPFFVELKENLKKELKGSTEVDMVFQDILSKAHNPYLLLHQGKEYKKQGKKYWKYYIQCSLLFLCKLRKKSGSEMYKIAGLFHDIGDWQNSKKWYKRLLLQKNLPSSVMIDALANLGEIAYSIGNRKWKSYFRKCLGVLTSMPEQSIYDKYRVASILKKIGQYGDARVKFQELINQSNEKQLIGGAYFHLGEICLATKNDFEAANCFRKALEFIPRHKKAFNYLDSS